MWEPKERQESIKRKLLDSINLIRLCGFSASVLMLSWSSSHERPTNTFDYCYTGSFSLKREEVAFLLINRFWKKEGTVRHQRASLTRVSLGGNCVLRGKSPRKSNLAKSKDGGGGGEGERGEAGGTEKPIDHQPVELQFLRLLIWTTTRWSGSYALRIPFHSVAVRRLRRRMASSGFSWVYWVFWNRYLCFHAQHWSIESSQ